MPKEIYLYSNLTNRLLWIVAQEVSVTQNLKVTASLPRWYEQAATRLIMEHPTRSRWGIEYKETKNA